MVVAGMFRAASGIGRSARACADALERYGQAPICVDLSDVFDQVDLPADRDLSPMPQTRSGTLLLHFNGPETERALLSLKLEPKAAWRIIGVWAWELSVAPLEWRIGAKYLSEIWTPSQFVTDTISTIVDIPVCTAGHYVPVAVTPNLYTLVQTDKTIPDDAFVCLVMADGRSSFDRKNLIGAVEMFLAAFPKESTKRLLIKSRNLTEYGDMYKRLAGKLAVDERLVLIDQTLTLEAVSALQARCDILLSPHRAEGFGFHLAEAMALGRCVIATGWSGNMDFMTPENSVLLPYKLVDVSGSLPAYQKRKDAKWAEPDFARGVEALVWLASDAAARAQMGVAARQSVLEKLNGAVWHHLLTE